MEAADDEAIAAAQRRIEVDEELTRAGDERDVAERNRPDRLNRQPGRRRCRGLRSGIGESSEEASAQRTSIRLRSTDTSASSTRPPRSARNPVVNRASSMLTSRADADPGQLEADARQQPRHRRPDRHRMSEGGRGLRFERRLDAVAAEKDANRQRQAGDEERAAPRHDDDSLRTFTIGRSCHRSALRRSSERGVTAPAYRTAGRKKTLSPRAPAP